MDIIDEVVLDTLQMYFPWDADLSADLKIKGLGTENTKQTYLPLIYTDNCLSTLGTDSLQRPFVINPSYYEETYESLNWIENSHNETKPIIPAERPVAEIYLTNSRNSVRIDINHRINGKEEYHLEYPSKTDNVYRYINWVNIYFTFDDFKNTMEKIIREIEVPPTKQYSIQVESKNEQREEFYYVSLPIKYYKFSLNDFRYAEHYLRYNGVRGIIPSLGYDSSDTSQKEFLSPLLKFGIVHTTRKHEFMHRDMQFVMKVAQPKITIFDGQRKRIKGMLIENEPFGNWIDIPTDSLVNGFLSLLNWHISR